MLYKVLTGKLTFTSSKPCDLSNTSKREIREYFENSYNLDESIYTALTDDSVFYTCPDRLRLPLIFYYGHTACVYVNKLILAELIQPEERVNIAFDTIFETGVDEMSWDDTENYRMGGKFQWPTLDDVIAYRKKIRELILRVIDEATFDLPITSNDPMWALFLGMEHERIHLETSSVLMRQLPAEMVQRPEGFVYGPLKGKSPAGQNIMLKVPTSNATLGKPADFPSFGWDNEYGTMTKRVPQFEASRYLVTNREFLGFVECGGYQQKELWSKDGWEWNKFRQTQHPTFWVCPKGCKNGSGLSLGSYSHCAPPNPNGVNRNQNSYAEGSHVEDTAESHVTNGQNGYCNGHINVDDNGHQGSDEGGGHCQYRLRCMYDVVNMPWDWPVEVNYHEAKAFCAWKGPKFRLPSEAEHHVIRGPMKSPTEGTCCDIIYQDDIKENINLKFGSSTPVNMHRPNELGFYDVFGNVWEWTEDNFNGLPGFSTNPVYDDFSSPCFDGRHNSIMGGSWISTGDEASRFARFAFRQHFFQHCGFRVLRDVSEQEDTHCKVPIRLIDTPIYIGHGEIIENQIPKDSDCDVVPTLYSHYTQDSETMLQDQLCHEYGANNLSGNIVNKMVSVLETYTVRTSRALHLGCGVGSITFKLQQYFDQVMALDISGRFIDACLQLQNGDPVSFTMDGKQVEAEIPVTERKREITFKQLSWLPNEIGVFTFVLAMMFDRVQNTAAWTIRFKELVESEGTVVVISDGTWTKEQLDPLMCKYFQCVEEGQTTLDGRKDKNQVITVWRRL